MPSDFLRPTEIEMIRNDVADFTKRKIKAGQLTRVFKESDHLFQTKKAGDWLKQAHSKPPSKQLFGSLWAENELCIMFADTNLGKSILAVQIADSLTKLYSADPFYNMLDAAPRVLYIDFELSSEQFFIRYHSKEHGSHHFSENFYRSEFNPAATANVIYYRDYNDYANQEIEVAVKKAKATVLIIDNISCIRNSTTHASAAIGLMQTLKALKSKNNLSVLVLAHTPKRNQHKPLTINDLQGSKMLINFADSAFAIGQSHAQPGLRYLKQIKQRSSHQQYGENNIALIRLENHLNFLRYKVEGFAREQDHLRPPETLNRELLFEQITTLYKQGLGLRKIADEVGLHFTTVGRLLKENGIMKSA